MADTEVLHKQEVKVGTVKEYSKEYTEPLSKDGGHICPRPLKAISFQDELTTKLSEQTLQWLHTTEHINFT